MAKILSWEWQDYQTITSTNDIALSQRLFSNKLLITAANQTKGRGRLGNTWQSFEGNLFFTQLIRADLPISQLSFISSLSLAQTCSYFGFKGQVSIKWPNDVLLSGKKFCGILIEQSGNNVAIGIGINLLSHPQSGSTPYATTDIASEGVTITRDEFLAIYLQLFDTNFAACSQDFAKVRATWLSYVTGIGHFINIKTVNKTLSGIFKGIDETGLLLLEQDNQITKIAAGEVFFNTEH